ncbi:MAG TPA: YdcF family protein [Gaiellaceae bacterium]|nr:YdcF family protein [Gaiellaceae bacterium]
MKLLVVLGYSDGSGDGLHPICAARLERAAEVAHGADAVVLTGWARRRDSVPEAELMRRAWRAPGRVICETEARITAENAAEVAHLVRELGAREVAVVTSWWHRPRAALLFRLLVGPTGARVRVVAAARPSPLRLVLRELACFALVPAQVRRARRGPVAAGVASASEDA